MTFFINEEILLQIGAIIQKSDNLYLDGFFALEIFAKDSNIEKFNFEGKLLMAKNECKMELIKYKCMIEEVVIKKDNIIVDNYILRWNKILINGTYRTWFKELSYNITKMDVIFLDYVKDIFIESNGANYLIDLKEMFSLINNEITILKNITNKKDAGIRTW
ncbi:hypothetical protein C1646_759610 [Rhizophagus diaphanus]|nr:hypothetical protein C1646_759610 [Rhizophagus diaphanus] [Rhizophagus sp. MUCL 43196]